MYVYAFSVLGGHFFTWHTWFWPGSLEIALVTSLACETGREGPTVGRHCNCMVELLSIQYKYQYLIKILDTKTRNLPSSTTSPTKTLAMPDMAMTTFWPTEHPVIVCMIRFTAALGNAARRYISYLSSCSSVKFETRTLKHDWKVRFQQW